MILTSKDLQHLSIKGQIDMLVESGLCPYARVKPYADNLNSCAIDLNITSLKGCTIEDWRGCALIRRVGGTE